MLNNKTLEKILWVCAVLFTSIPLVTVWVNVLQPIPKDLLGAIFVSWTVIAVDCTVAFIGRFG